MGRKSWSRASWRLAAAMAAMASGVATEERRCVLVSPWLRTRRAWRSTCGWMVSRQPSQS
eukprot:4424337-Prymnesium_polylepis.1